MSEQKILPAAFIDGWQVYQNYLITALTPLSSEQLALSAAPSLWSVGMLAEHIVGARVGWFHGRMGEGSAELAPMADWDEHEGPPQHSAAELVAGLEVTWQMMQDALARWTPADLDVVFQNPYFVEGSGVGRRERSRQWILWHVLEHDLHHGGEISLTLGMHGLTGLDV